MCIWILEGWGDYDQTVRKRMKAYSHDMSKDSTFHVSLSSWNNPNHSLVSWGGYHVLHRACTSAAFNLLPSLSHMPPHPFFPSFRPTGVNSCIIRFSYPSIHIFSFRLYFFIIINNSTPSSSSSSVSLSHLIYHDWIRKRGTYIME